MDEERIQKLESFIGLRISKAAESIKKAIEEHGKGERLVYTAADVAQQCGLKVSTIKKEVKRGRLEGFIKNGRLLITAEAFKSWLAVRDKPRKAERIADTAEERKTRDDPADELENAEKA